MSSENAASNTNVVNENDVIEQEQELINFADDQSKFGLALSGGGVRSAAFCLGVIQALHEKGKFKLFDYLSTVSGGGYIGASLIWWLHYFKKEGKNSFPFSVKTADDRKILDYLRTHINYLLPTPRLKLTSFLAVILRMIIVSLFVYISIATTALLALLIVISISFDSFKSLVEFLTSQEEINSIELSVAEFFDYYWYFVPNTYLVFAAVVFLIIYNLIEFFKPLETYRKQKNLFLLKFLARFHKVTQSLVFISPIYFVDINSAVLYLRDRLPNDLSALEKFIANQLLFADLYLLSLFIFGCFAYSILTVIYQFLNKFFESNDWINFRYAKRRESQAIFGKVILISVVLLLLSLIIFSVAAIDKGPQDEYWIILSLFLSLLIFGPAINILFAIFGSATSKTLSTIVPTIGAMTYLSGIAIGVFQFSDYLISARTKTLYPIEINKKKAITTNEDWSNNSKI